MLPPRYENPSLLGKGANANVYKAFDTQRQVPVTFKWGIKHLSRHAPFRVRWYQEVFLLQEASGPNIVQIYDYGIWDECPYMVLEFVQDTLTSALSTPKTVSCRLSWLLQLLDALLTLHLRGIIHQDINPDNILIEADRLWLTDFSVARSKSMIHADASEVSGTMGWSAPEQQKREHKWVDCWTDIFSWGRIAHYLFQEDPAFSYIQDVVIQATAPKCLDRFSSVTGLRKVFRDRMKKIPEDVLQSKHRVQDIIPVPFDAPIPQVLIPKVRHDMVHSEQTFGGHVRDAIRSSFVKVHHLSTPKMVVISEKHRAESRSIIFEELHFLQKKYGPHVFSLDYEKTEGILQLVRDWVAPYKEKHEETVERIQRTILSSRNIRAFQKEREANILALWSRRNVLTESEVGILFFIQKLQEQAQEGPIVLLVNQPQLSRFDGEGLELCIMLLSKMFFSIPLLIIVRMDAHEDQQNRLEQQGATIIQLQKPTKEQFALVIQHDVDKWYDVCAGSIERWRTIHQEEVLAGERYIDIVDRMFHRFEQKATESTKVFVRAIALSIRPVPVYACRERAEELDEAFRFQILRVEGRWITFCHPQIAVFLQKRTTAHAGRLLGDLWKKAEHEDTQERYVSWCHAMALAGSWKIVQPVLKQTAEQCFLFRRSNLVHESLRLWKRYEQDFPTLEHQGYQAFILVQSGRDWSEWGNLFLRCNSTHKTIIVMELLKRGHKINEEALADTYRSEFWWNVLAGEKAFSQEQEGAAQFFYDAYRALEPKNHIRTWALMRWIELSLYQGEGFDSEDRVVSMVQEARQLSSVRSISCASFAYGLFCFSQKRFTEGLHRLYHAGSTALICGNWGLWSRIMSHIAAYFLCNNQRTQALEVLHYKRTTCEIKKIRCPNLAQELWLVHGYKGEIPYAATKTGLDALCVVLSTPSRSEWLRHKNTIYASLHPFVFAFLPMLPDDVISASEQTDFQNRGVLRLY